MAYLIRLHSLPADKVIDGAISSENGGFVSCSGFCSHLVIAFCPEVEAALDRGEPIAAGTAHNPIRGPMIYWPHAVPQALACLEAAIGDPSSIKPEYRDWTLSELSLAVELYRHAVERGEAVVSILV